MLSDHPALRPWPLTSRKLGLEQGDAEVFTESGWGPARPRRGPAPETSASPSARSGELRAFSGLSEGIFRGRAFCKSTSST